jgi:tripartite-type tricarboxylate transporter receptor subunit TctC
MLRRLALTFLFVGAFGAALAADPWPARQVSIVVGFAPGGNTDMAARVLASGMKAALPVPVVVENKPGAGGTVGAAMVVRAAPDGTTLLVGSQSETAMLKANRAKPPYDIERDLAPIGRLMDYHFVVTVSKTLNIHDWNEFVAYAKQKGSLTYGTPGVGTTAHVLSEYLLASMGIKGVHVPYQGAASLRPDHIAGRFDFSVDVIPLIMPLLSEGQLRPLAVTLKERDTRLPNVPSLIELGVFKEEFGGWTGVFAPKATPPDVRAKLLALVNQTLKGAGGEEIRRNGYRPAGEQAPNDFAAFVAADEKRWLAVFRKAGIPPSN